MAWNHYYINMEKLYDPENCPEDLGIFWELKIPPHGGIRREWTTIGMKHDGAAISYVEYRLEDDDPDGVWEAYGMKRDSEYSFTVHAENADPEKLFVYTLDKDGTLHTGFDIDPSKAGVILTFARKQDISAAQLADVWEKVKQAPRVQGAVEGIVIRDLLNGMEDQLCLAYFQR